MAPKWELGDGPDIQFGVISGPIDHVAGELARFEVEPHALEIVSVEPVPAKAGDKIKIVAKTDTPLTSCEVHFGSLDLGGIDIADATFDKHDLSGTYGYHGGSWAHELEVEVPDYPWVDQPGNAQVYLRGTIEWAGPRLSINDPPTVISVRRLSNVYLFPWQPPAPKIESFGAIFGVNEDTVVPGEHVHLRWRVKYATEITVQRIGQEGPPWHATYPSPTGYRTEFSQTQDIGAFTRTTPTKATYEIEAKGFGPSRKQRCTVELVVPPAEIIEFAGTDTQPGLPVTLRWRVKNARRMKVTRVGSVGPDVSLTREPDPSAQKPIADFQESYSTKDGFAGNSMLTATYELEAESVIGVKVTRQAHVSLYKEPSLNIAGIEVVQAIQKYSFDNPSVVLPVLGKIELNNSVTLVAGKTTWIRVYVSTTDLRGFDYGLGQDVQPNVTGRVTVTGGAAGLLWDRPVSGVQLAGDAVTVPAPQPGSISARPAQAIDRGSTLHSLVWIMPGSQVPAGAVDVRAEVWVQRDSRGADHETDRGGSWWATKTAKVSFVSHRRQEVVKILVRNDAQRLAAPNDQEFGQSLAGCYSRHPVPDDGFPIHLYARSNTYSTTRDLTTTGGWQDLLDDIEDEADTDSWLGDGRFWTAVVRLGQGYVHGGYGYIGMLSSGRGSWFANMCSHYAMVAVAGWQDSLAHEMGHAWGMNHAPAGNPPAPIDSRLPGFTEEVAVDADIYHWAPAAAASNRRVIPKSSPELMSYGGGRGWPSIACWDIVSKQLR